MTATSAGQASVGYEGTASDGLTQLDATHTLTPTTSAADGHIAATENVTPGRGSGGEFTLAFVGYGGEEDRTVLELTYNWDQKEPYAIGTGFGHLAISVADAYKACTMLGENGVRIARPAGPLKFGTTVIAFIDDPDGYKIELIQRP